MATEKVIICDYSCPFCCWYMDAFVHAGLLKEGNRLSFSQLSNKKMLSQLDLERSKDEIPLLNLTGETTLYDIDNLLEILGNRWPWIKIIAQIKPVNRFLRKLYKFISYNRRVIAATKPTEITGIDCTPHFHLFYRLVYLFLALALGVGKILFYYWSFFPRRCFIWQ
ncbi:MAG: DCC1-like thiol-disulfide oxidoreductase family protein [Bacteroidota bacterium]